MIRRKWNILGRLDNDADDENVEEDDEDDDEMTKTENIDHNGIREQYCTCIQPKTICLVVYVIKCRIASTNCMQIVEKAYRMPYSPIE